MPNRDLLVLAGMASEVLEGHGLVACGRRENGVTRVDFWTRNGKGYRHELTDAETLTVDEIVVTCLAIAAVRPASPRSTSHLS